MYLLRKVIKNYEVKRGKRKKNFPTLLGNGIEFIFFFLLGRLIGYHPVDQLNASVRKKKNPVPTRRAFLWIDISSFSGCFLLMFGSIIHFNSIQDINDYPLTSNYSLLY